MTPPLDEVARKLAIHIADQKDEMVHLVDVLDLIKKSHKAGRADGLESAAEIFDKKAEEDMEYLRKADTATAVSVWENSVRHWKNLAATIRAKEEV